MLWEGGKLFAAPPPNLVECGQLAHQAARLNDWHQEGLALGCFVDTRDEVADEPAPRVTATKDLFGHRIRPLTGTELEPPLPFQLHEFVHHSQRWGIAGGDQLSSD